MEGGILIFLCLTMLLGSFIAGMLPLTLNLSENKMRHITILGAGLLIGTALAVIVPEGIHTLYANQKCISHGTDHPLRKRDLSWMSEQQQQPLGNIRNQEYDQEAINFFLKQISRDKNLNVRTWNYHSSYNYPVNIQRVQSYISQHNQQHDQEAMRQFYAQISRDKNLNVRNLAKRIAQTNELTDEEKIEMFLASLNGQRVIELDDAMKKLKQAKLSARDLLELLANQIDQLDGAQETSVNKEEEEEKVLSRHKRDLAEPNKESKVLNKDTLQGVIEKSPVGVGIKDLKIEDEHDEVHSGESNAHSAIGVTLVLGFVFMLFIDQIGGKIGHRHQTLDSQSIRNKITFSTTLGLIVHAAADGIALGAAAATSKTDIEMIVFFAIMLHKAPAAFGLVSFLIHEGLDRARVRKHLAVFALAAPIMAIVTFIALKSGSNVNMVTSDSTGLCMLFSAGTFLYVSTVHVLPEVQSHNEDRQFRFAETMSFVIGAVIPLFLTINHGH